MNRVRLFVVGLSYRATPVGMRERLAVAPGALGHRAGQLRLVEGLDEVVLLSTCNRVEVYGVAPALPGDPSSLLQLPAPCRGELREHVYVHEGAEALTHLFAVTSGLDSMVLGETEITGQVKEAYEQARLAGATGRVLNRVFQKALQTAKEVRTHTSIGRGATSVGSVAVELAVRIFGPSLAGQAVMIVGAGQMGETCIRHLAKRGAQTLLVSNRSPERAEGLVAEFGGRVVPFDQWVSALAEADIVITSAGCPHFLLARTEVERLLPARRGRPLCLIDISVPRNVDPEVGRLDTVYLFNLDDLESIARQNASQRAQAQAAAQEIIARRLAALLPRLAGGATSGPEDPPRESDTIVLPDWIVPVIGNGRLSHVLEPTQ